MSYDRYEILNFEKLRGELCEIIEACAQGHPEVAGQIAQWLVGSLDLSKAEDKHWIIR